MNTSFFAKAAGSALIAASLFAGASANAAVTTLDFTGESATFGNSFVAGVATFSDDYLFDVAALSSGEPVGGITVSKVKVVGNNGKVPTIIGTKVSFFQVEGDGSHTLLATEGDFSDFSLSSLLPAGHYGFNFSGKIKDIAKGGSYGGTLTLNVSPVPEPETYALLLAGLGLLAFTARRKENNKVG
jgi:hypothetical protein